MPRFPMHSPLPHTYSFLHCQHAHMNNELAVTHKAKLKHHQSTFHIRLHFGCCSSWGFTNIQWHIYLLSTHTETFHQPLHVFQLPSHVLSHDSCPLYRWGRTDMKDFNKLLKSPYTTRIGRKSFKSNSSDSKHSS